MNGSLVDTNAIIKVLNGDKNAIDLFDKLEDIKISSITAGELYYGAHKSSKVNENLKLFTDFLSEYPVIEIDSKIGNVYGEIKASLVKRGINIP